MVQTNTTGDITTCTFMGNTALNGGAVYQNMASGSILRTAFTDNVAGQKGGALFGESSTGNIMNSTFTMNRASQAGGAGERGHWSDQVLMSQVFLVCIYSYPFCRCHPRSYSRTYFTGWPSYSLFLSAVFLNNCASSMSFSIFTQNDAGQGGGGAVYRYASCTQLQRLTRVISQVLQVCDQTLKECLLWLQECLQGLHHKLQLH